MLIGGGVFIALIDRRSRRRVMHLGVVHPGTRSAAPLVVAEAQQVAR
jgi:hypothetical protein